MTTSKLRRLAGSVTAKTTVQQSALLLKPLAAAHDRYAPRSAGRFGLFSAAASVYVLGSLLAGSAWANPLGGSVVAGKASIEQATPNTLNVVQSSDKAIVNWQSFNVGASETVNFQQPNAKSVTLNRVTGNDPSAIFGSINANGTVMLVNPNGIVFGSTARVDVGGLVASTANISNGDFMAGNYHFGTASANKDARIVNQGEISIRDAGLAALVAPGVENSGTIKARLGKVALGGAETFTLDFQGDGLLSFDASSVVSHVPNGANGKALVVNSGKISADGGSIELSARAVQGVINNVINTDGVLVANSVGTQNGRIVLSGGDNGSVAIAGAVKAMGNLAGSTGGSVTVTGSDIRVANSGAIDVSGQAGGGRIALGSDGTANGTWTAVGVAVASGATLKADALNKGDGGRVTVVSTQNTQFAGSISAKGGAHGGNGGFSEISSHLTLTLNGNIDLTAPLGQIGSLLIDPSTLEITDSSAVSNTGNVVTRGWLESQSGNANISLTATGLITVDAMAGGLVNLATTSGNTFALSSTLSDGIRFVDANTEIRTAGGNLSLSALGVGASLTNIGKLTTNGGSINLAANSGITLGNALNAGAGNVSIRSVAGSIGNTVGGTAGTLSGAAVTLSAATGNLGSASSSVLTATGALSVETGGHLYLDNTGTLSSLAITANHVQPNPANTYALTSTGLSFAVVDGADLHADNVSQAGLNLSFSTDRNLMLGTLDVGGGNLNVASSAGNLLGSNGTLLAANALNLSAAGNAGINGGIGNSGQAINTAATTMTVNTGTGGAYVANTGNLNLTNLTVNGASNVATDGDLTVGTVAAPGRSIGLAATGDIVDDGIPATQVNASALSLTAGGGVGSSFTPFVSNATSFSASSDSGGVYVNLTGASATLGNLHSGDGDIVLNTAGTTFAQNVSAVDHDITFNVANGNLTVGTVNAGSLGDVLLNVQGAGASIASNGQLLITGDHVELDTLPLGGGSVIVNTAANNLAITATSTITDTQTGAVNVTHLTSKTGAITFLSNSGDAVIGDVSTTGAVSLRTLLGNLFDDGLSSTSITGSAANLNSSSANLGTSSNHLHTSTTGLTLTSQGNIYVDNDKNLTLLNITDNHATPGTPNILAVTSPYLLFDVTDDGSQFRLGKIDSVQLQTLSFTGDESLVVSTVRAGPVSNVSLTATAGDVLDDSDPQTRITGSNVALTASAGSIGTAAHAVNVNAASLSASTAGNVWVDDIADLGNLTLNSTHADPNANYIFHVTAPSLLLDLNDSASGYTFNTLTDVTGLNFNFQGDRGITLGSLDVTRIGNLALTATQGSIIDDGDATTQSLANGITLRATQGSLGAPGAPLGLIAASINATAGNGGIDVKIPMPTNSTVNNVTFSGSAYGAINVEAVQGDLTVNTLNAHGNAVHLNADAGSILDPGATTITASSIDLNAAGAIGSATSAVRLNTPGVVNATAGAGLVNLTNTNGTFTLGTIEAGSSPVTLTGSGNLMDDGNNATVIHGSTVALTAVGALGSAATPLTVDTNTLSATAGGTMQVADLHNLASLALSSSSSSSANSFLITAPNLSAFTLTDNGGLFYLQNIVSGTPLALSFSGGHSLQVGTISDAGGSVNLTARSGNITNDGLGTTNITAASVGLGAASGSIGGSGTNSAITLAGTTALSAEAYANLYLTDDTALASLALILDSAAATANVVNLSTVATQTLTVGDNGAYVQTLNANGGGLTNYSFVTKKNIAVGNIAASGAVSLATSGGYNNGNAITMASGGAGISASSVALSALGAYTDAGLSTIGTSGSQLVVSTPNLSLQGTSNLYVSDNQTLSSLALDVRHNTYNLASNVSDYAPTYTYALSGANGLNAFTIADGTTIGLNNIVSNGPLAFSFTGDRALRLGTLNTGASGSVNVVSNGSYAYPNNVYPTITGAGGNLVTAGNVTLTATNYGGALGTSGQALNVSTPNLTLNSAGNIYASDNQALASLGLTANISNPSNSAAYSIGASNLSSNITYSNLYGIQLNTVNATSGNVALTVNSNQTLTIGTINTGASGSTTLTSSGLIQGQTTSSHITTGALAFNGSGVSIYNYGNLYPLLTTASSVAGNLTGSMYISNTGDLTLHGLTSTSAVRIDDSGSIYSDGTSYVVAPTLRLNASNGSLGAVNTPLLLDVRNLQTTSGYDLYVADRADLYSLDVTDNHAINRTNTLQVTAPRLTFNITDDGSQFHLANVTDLSGVDFSFSGDRTVSVGNVNGQLGREVSVTSTNGNLISDGTANLTGDQVNLTANGAIGSSSGHFTTNALGLGVSSRSNIYVDNTLDLSSLSLTDTQQNGDTSYNGATYSITAPHLTFSGFDDSVELVLNNVTDSTGLNLAATATAHNLGFFTINTSPTGVTNGGSIALTAAGEIFGSNPNRLTAASISLTSTNGAPVGDSSMTANLSAPLLNLNLTGNLNLASDTHIDALSVRSTHPSSSYATYSLVSPQLTFGITDDSAGTHLNNVSDTSDLSFSWVNDHPFVVGTVNLGTTGALNLNSTASGAAIVGDGNSATLVSAGSMSLSAQSGAIGASGAGNGIDAQVGGLTTNSNGGATYLNLTNNATLGGLSANGDIFIDNASGDIALGSISLNGHVLTVDNQGGSILSGSLNGATAVNLTADGSIGNNSAITTSNYSNGTTTLTASAATNSRGASGSVALNESYNLAVASVTAPGVVTLTAGYGMSVGTINAGSSAVTLTANQGDLTGMSGSNSITGSSVALSANYINGGTAYSIGSSGTAINVNTPVLTLTSPKNLYVADSADLSSLTINRAASTYTGGGALQLSAANLTSSMSDSASLTTLSNLTDTTGLDLIFNASHAIAVGTLNVGPTGNVTLNATAYQADASITAINGSELITAGALTMTANNYTTSTSSPGSIGTAGQALNTHVGTVTATARTGGLYLNNVGDITLTQLASAGALSVSSSAGGNITLGNLSYGAGQTLTLNAAGSLLAGVGALNGSNALSGVYGGMYLSAVNGIGTAAAPIVINAPGNGAIGNAVSATVTGNGDVNLMTGALPGGLSTAVANGATNVTTTGSILLNNMNSATDTIGNDISVVANSGNITFTNLSAGTTTGRINLTANTGQVLAKNASSVATAYGINVFGNTGIGSSTYGLNLVSQQGNVTSLGGAIYLSPLQASTLALVSSNGGNIYVNAGADVSLSNLLSGGGAITINDANHTVYAGNINAGANSVTINSGTLRDDGVAATRIVGGIVNLTSATGTGSVGDAVQTTAGVLNASVTGTGDLYLNDNNSAGLNLNAVGTHNGAVNIVSAGPLTATNVYSSTDSSANGIHLTASSGDLTLGAVTAGTGNATVTLDADDGAILHGLGSTTNVTAKAVSMNTANGIGTLTDLLSGAGTPIVLAVGTVNNLTTTAPGSVIAIKEIGNLTLGANAIGIPGGSSTYIEATGNLDARNAIDINDGNLALVAGGTLNLPTAAYATLGDLYFKGATDVLAGSNGRTLEATANSLHFVTGSQGGASTLNSITGNLNVSSSAHPLTVNNSGVLSHLTINGTDNIAFTNDSSFALDSVNTSGTAKTVSLTATDGDLTVGSISVGNAGTLNVTASAGDVNGPNSAISAGHLNVTANAIALPGVTTAIDQTYNGATTLSGDYVTHGAFTVNGAATLGADTSIVSNNGAIGLQTVDGAQALQIASGTGSVTLNDALGGNLALTSLSIAGSGTQALNGGSIATTGAQQYGNVVLGGDTQLSSQGGAIAFTGTLNGAHDLDVSAVTGDVTFAGVGGTTRLGAISVETAGASQFLGSVRAASVVTDDPGSVLLAGSSVNTTGLQHYGELVTLGANTVLTGSDVTLAGGADSSVGGAKTLSIVGTAHLSGAFGANNALGNLTVTGDTTLSDTNINTTGAQLFDGALSLAGSNSMVTDNAAWHVTGAVDGAGDLSVSTGTGDVTFDAALGGNARIGALQINSAGTTTFTGSITAASLDTDAGGNLVLSAGFVDTTGDQHYGEHLTLSTDTVLTGGTVTLANGVDASTAGAQALTIHGNAVLGAVGGNAALASLAVSGDSALAGVVNTTGAQTYDNALILNADTVLSASTINLLGGVGGTTAGGQSLTISGDAVFGGEQGANAPLANLNVNGASRFNGGSLITTGTQSYTGAVSLAGDQILSSGGSVVFGNTVDSTNASSLNVSAGDINFANAIGSHGALGGLTVASTSPTGIIRFSGDITATTGFVQTGGAKVYLPTNVTVTQGGISLGTLAELSGPQASIHANGDVDMLGLYGPNTALTLAAGTGALKIGRSYGNTLNGDLLQVAKLTVPNAGSARIYGSIGIVGGRQAATSIDSILTRAPYYINDTPWGGANDLVSQIVSTIFPRNVVSSTPNAGSLFFHAMNERGITPDPLGAYGSPKVLSVTLPDGSVYTQSTAPNGKTPAPGTCSKSGPDDVQRCGL